MSQIQSTERLNLTIEDSQKNSVELPFRILVISDLTADERSEAFEEDSVWSGEDGVDGLMAKQSLYIPLKVPNLIEDDDQTELLIEFEPSCLEDFHPEYLLNSTPQLRHGYDLYRLLSDSSVPSTTLTGMLGELNIEVEEDALDSSTRFALLAEIENRLSSQLDSILNHSTFKQLESSWRSLDFLLEQVDFDENIDVQILNISKQGLAEDFEDSADVTRSSLYDLVYSQEYGQFGGKPYGLIVGDFDFGPQQQDMRLLQEIASVSAVSHTPFVAAASSKFFGFEDYQQFSKIRDLDAHFLQPAYAKWNSFRQNPDARYVGLAMPRFILRENYTLEDKMTFPYQEKVSKKTKGGCWGNAAYAVASRFADSFARYRWLVNSTGEDHGVIEELEMKSGVGAQRTKIPTEVLVTDRSESDLVKNGFIPLTVHKSTRKAVLLSIPSCCGINDDGSRGTELDQRLENQLPYMFISCRFSQYLKMMQRENIGTWNTRPQLESELNRWLKQYISDMDNPTPSVRARRPLREARIKVREAENNPSWYFVSLVITPHLKYMGNSFTLSASGKLDKA